VSTHALLETCQIGLLHVLAGCRCSRCNAHCTDSASSVTLISSSSSGSTEYGAVWLSVAFTYCQHIAAAPCFLCGCCACIALQRISSMCADQSVSTDMHACMCKHYSLSTMQVSNADQLAAVCELRLLVQMPHSHSD
jgi:hypothetical protein